MSKRGGIRIRDGRIYARVRFGQDERLEERLPWATVTDREAAELRSGLIGELCDQLVDAGRRDCVKQMAREAAIAPTPVVLATVKKAVAAIAKAPAPGKKLATFKDVADDWVEGRLREKYPDHVQPKADFKIEVARLRDYIYPHVKDVPIAAFAKEHGDLVMSKLPAEHVKTPGTRRHIAQIIHRVLALAVMPLGLIPSNPLPEGWLPRVERHRHYTCLFPREEALLLGCEDVAEVDRLFFGVLDREGMRVSELVDCEWWQWGEDCRTFTATKTKTGDPRMWAVRPDVAEAMRIWKQRHRKRLKRPFIEVAANENEKPYIAGRLRDGLRLAGVNRRELLVRTEHTGELRAHDLRATFVTVSIAEGKTDLWIRDRTGHKTLTMVDRYRRAARQFEELNLGSLGDLVELMGWGNTRGILAIASGDEGGRSDEDSSQFRRRDSNPDKRIQNSRGRSATLRSVPNRREIATAGDALLRGIPQGSPTLVGLAGGLAIERAQWAVFDAFEDNAEVGS